MKPNTLPDTRFSIPAGSNEGLRADVKCMLSTTNNASQNDRFKLLKGLIPF